LAKNAVSYAFSRRIQVKTTLKTLAKMMEDIIEGGTQKSSMPLILLHGC
jgi:hypothetical protein